MSKKSLLKTNISQDPKKRQEIIKTVTVSSSAIEGVHTAAQQAIFKVVKISKSRPALFRPGKYGAKIFS